MGERLCQKHLFRGTPAADSYNLQENFAADLLQVQQRCNHRFNFCLWLAATELEGRGVVCITPANQRWQTRACDSSPSSTRRKGLLFNDRQGGR